MLIKTLAPLFMLLTVATANPVPSWDPHRAVNDFFGTTGPGYYSQASPPQSPPSNLGRGPGAPPRHGYVFGPGSSDYIRREDKKDRRAKKKGWF